MPTPFRTAALAAGGLALTAALVVAAPLVASAHVHVDPVQARAGADHVDLSFTVPNESPTATTTAVSIALPATFTTVQPAAVRGWRTTTAGGAVRFTATGGGVGDGQTQTFVVRVGPVPAVDHVALPVTQTYSDGTSVRWDEATPASGAEPEHPAPVLYVQGRAPADDDDAAGAPADGSSTAAIVLASAALAVGVVAVVLAALALLRSRGRRR